MKFGIIKFISLFLSSNFFVQKLAGLPKILYLCKVVAQNRLRGQRIKTGITAPAAKLNAARRPIKRRPPPNLAAGGVI